MARKQRLLLTLVVLMATFLISSANACAANAALRVDVSTNPQVVVPTQSVTIACTSNMNGIGIVFVVQPEKASSAASSQSEEVQMDLNTVSRDTEASQGKIISYVEVKIPNAGGGRQDFTFPEDFTGLNGEPSTEKTGRYFVFFIFLHLHCIRIGFDCASFFVVPEVPLGTLGVAVATFSALLGYTAIRKQRTKRHFM